MSEVRPPTTPVHFLTVRSMKPLKYFCLMIAGFAKGALLLPVTIATGFRHRRERAVVDELEVERLDRIRNPSKYLGKQ
jgi:hypothetical protein